MEVVMTVTVDDFLAWLRQQAPNRRFRRTCGGCALVAYFDERCRRHEHYYAADCIFEQFQYSVCYRLSEAELAFVARVNAVLSGDSYTVSELLVAMQRAEVNDKEVLCPSHRQS